MTMMAATLPTSAKEQQQVVILPTNPSSFSVSRILLRSNDEAAAVNTEQPSAVSAVASSSAGVATSATGAAAAASMKHDHDVHSHFLQHYMLLQQLLLGDQKNLQPQAATIAATHGSSKSSPSQLCGRETAAKLLVDKKNYFLEQLKHHHQSSTGDNNANSSGSIPTSSAISTFLCAVAAAAAAAATHNGTTASSTTAPADAHRLFLNALPSSQLPQLPAQPMFPWQLHSSTSATTLSLLPRPVPSYALPANILANLHRQQQQSIALKSSERIYPPSLPPFHHHHAQPNNNLSNPLSSHVFASTASDLKNFFPLSSGVPPPFGPCPQNGSLPLSSAFERPMVPPFTANNMAVPVDEKKHFEDEDGSNNEVMDDDADEQASDGGDDNNIKMSDDDDEDDDYTGEKRNHRTDIMGRASHNSFPHRSGNNGGNFHSRHINGGASANNTTAISSSSCGKKKKTRTVFSRSQVFQLESAFEMKRYLSSSDRAGLAASLNLTEQQIKIWFQNRRNKWKRQYSTDFTDPARRLGSIGQCPSSMSQSLPTSGSPLPHHHSHHHHPVSARYAALSQLTNNGAMLPQHGLPHEQNFSYAPPPPLSLSSAGSSSFSTGISQPLAKFNNSFLPPPTSSSAAAAAAAAVAAAMLAGNHQNHLLSPGSFYAAAAAAAAATVTTTTTDNDLKINSSSHFSTANDSAAVNAAALRSLFNQQQHGANPFWPSFLPLPTSFSYPSGNNGLLQTPVASSGCSSGVTTTTVASITVPGDSGTTATHAQLDSTSETA